MGTHKDRQKLSIIEVVSIFRDDRIAENWFIQQRWGDNVTCPHCDSDRVKERVNARGKQAWRCNACRKDFTTKTGTLMQGSNLGYRTWALAIYLLTTNLKGIASTKLASDLDITQKSAWHLAMRIRETYRDNAFRIDGGVEVDETFIGGKQTNRSKKVQAAAKEPPAKQIVVDRKERGSKVKAMPVINTGARTLQSAERDNAQAGAMLDTDELCTYKGLAADCTHEAVNHSAWEYVKGQAHTNGIESVWSMLKRGYMRTHHHTICKHLGRYVNEFAERHNDRTADTMDQMAAIAPYMTGRTLPYRELTA